MSTDPVKPGKAKKRGTGEHELASAVGEIQCPRPVKLLLQPTGEKVPVAVEREAKGISPARNMFSVLATPEMEAAAGGLAIEEGAGAGVLANVVGAIEEGAGAGGLANVVGAMEEGAGAGVLANVVGAIEEGAGAGVLANVVGAIEEGAEAGGLANVVGAIEEGAEVMEVAAAEEAAA